MNRFLGNMRLKRIFKQTVAAIVFGVSLFSVAPAEAMPEIMPLTEVQEGMTGTGWTVIDSSGEIVPFGVEVLGVVQGGKGDQAMIIARASGPVINSSGGIIHGMSGSPVYIDGQLVGAASATLKNMEPATFLITPIEEMLKIWELPDKKKPKMPEQIDFKKVNAELEAQRKKEAEKKAKKEAQKAEEKAKAEGKKAGGKQSADKKSEDIKTEEGKTDSKQSGEKTETAEKPAETPAEDKKPDAKQPEEKPEADEKQADGKKPDTGKHTIMPLDGGKSISGGREPEYKSALYKNLLYDSAVTAPTPAGGGYISEQASGKNGNRFVETLTGEENAERFSDSMRYKDVMFVGGFDPVSYSFLENKLGLLGYKTVPMAGFETSSAGNTVYDATIEPGASFGIAIVHGDFTVGGMGTATVVDGNRLLGFGHAMFGKGNVSYFLTETDIIGMVKGLTEGMKLGNVKKVIGRINQDRTAGVGGIIGEYPSVVGVRVTVNDEGSNRQKSYAASVAYDETVLPILANGISCASLNRTIDSQAENTVKVKFTIMTNAVPDGKVERTNYFYAPADVGQQAFAELTEAVNLICTNTDKESDIYDVKVELAAAGERRTASIISAVPDRPKVRPGDTVIFKTSIKPYRKKPIKLDIPFTVPKTRKEGRWVLDMHGGGLVALPLLMMEGIVNPDAPILSTEEKLGSFMDKPSNNQIIVEPGVNQKLMSEKELKEAMKAAAEQSKGNGKADNEEPPVTRFDTEYVIDNVIHAVVEVDKKAPPPAKKTERVTVPNRRNDFGLPLRKEDKAAAEKKEETAKKPDSVKPEEGKQAEAKKLGAEKPAGDKSAEEAKPGDTKGAEAKPAETKTEEVKPAEVQPDEAKSAGEKPAEPKADTAKPDGAVKAEPADKAAGEAAKSAEAKADMAKTEEGKSAGAKPDAVRPAEAAKPAEKAEPAETVKPSEEAAKPAEETAKPEEAAAYEAEKVAEEAGKAGDEKNSKANSAE